MVRFFGANPLHDAGQQPFVLVQLIVEVGQENLQPFRLRLAGPGPARPLIQLDAQLFQQLASRPRISR